MKLVLAAMVVLMTAGCNRGDEPPTRGTTCIDDLVAHRASVDATFATDEYPLSAEQKASFEGLTYFPPSAAYCIPANFKEAAASETFDMPTYNEKSLPFREYGTFEFEVDGADYSLTAYQRMDLPDEKRQWVLVPFKDATNGRETYGGGRYLEIQLPIDAETEIDFNRASNPWCAYNARYTCPIPPARNRLRLSIEAGEKMFGVEYAHEG